MNFFKKDIIGKIINLILIKMQTRLQSIKVSPLLMSTLFKLLHFYYKMLIYEEKKSLNFSYEVFVFKERISLNFFYMVFACGEKKILNNNNNNKYI